MMYKLFQGVLESVLNPQIFFTATLLRRQEVIIRPELGGCRLQCIGPGDCARDLQRRNTTNAFLLGGQKLALLMAQVEKRACTAAWGICLRGSVEVRGPSGAGGG